MSINHPLWCRHHVGPPAERGRDLIHQSGDIVLARDAVSGEALTVSRVRFDEVVGDRQRIYDESYVVAFGSDFAVLDGRQWSELATQLERVDWSEVRRQLGEDM